MSNLPENAIQLKTYIEESFGKNYYGIFFTDALLEQIKASVLQEVKSELSWKEAVDNFEAIATTYTNPEEGWTVSVKDTNNIYRYDAARTEWVNILSNAVSSVVTTLKDGLMPKELFTKFENNKLPAAEIIETDLKKFVSEAKITEWNNKVSFPGFSGTGSYYGTENFAARSNHQHQTLNNIETISIKNGESNSIIFVKPNERNLIKIYSDDNSLHIKNSTSDFWFRNNGQAGVDDRTFLDNFSNLDITKITGINSSWHSVLNANYSNPDWNDIRNKPASFTPNEHNHLLTNITDINDSWHNLLRNTYRVPNVDWNTNINNKPNDFVPSNHNHNYLFTNEENLFATENTRDGSLDNKTFMKYFKTNIDGRECYVLRFETKRNNGLQKFHELAFQSSNDSEGNNNRLIWKMFNKENGREEFKDYLACLNRNQQWRGYQDFLSGAGNTGSDMRFKNNTKPVQNVLDKVEKLEIFDYDWIKEGEERNTFGVNANQLIEFGDIFEKIVHERDDEDKTKWVEYDRFGVIAIKALQEFISEQRKENMLLKNKIRQLQARLNSK